MVLIFHLPFSPKLTHPPPQILDLKHVDWLLETSYTLKDKIDASKETDILEHCSHSSEHFNGFSNFPDSKSAFNFAVDKAGGNC